MDNSSDFKIKLQALYNDKGITKRLRTHLRQLILTELQHNDADKKYPVITIKARAIGALIVEWLHLYDCHYTLSVLASEIPSLVDLPMLSNEGSQKKLQDDEVEEVLSALGLKSNEIMTEYQKNNTSLIATAFKTASTWKARLEFKEFPLSPRILGEEEPHWAKSLKDIISDTYASPEKLNFIYSALYSFIQSEVEDRISNERQSLFDELLLRENSIKDKLKEQEANILSKLVEVKQGIHQTKGKAEEELVQKRHLVLKLMEDVQTQHQAVLGGLSELKMREEKFDNEKKLWQKFKENEHTKLKEKKNDLKKKEDELKELADIIAAKEADFQEKIKQRAVQNQSTSTSLKLEVYKEQRLPPSTSSKPGRSNIAGDEIKSSLTKQKTVGESSLLETDGGQHTAKKVAIISSSTSDSSISSYNQPDGTQGATLRRIKELRDETKRNLEDFHESRRAIDSDSSSSGGDSPNMLKLHRKDVQSTMLSRSQITLPFVREGCHSPTHSHVYPSSSRSITKRYQSLLDQGDQNQSKNLSSRDTFKKIQRTCPEPNNRETLEKLKEQSKILENLIQAARKQTASTQKEENIEKQKIIRDGKKIKSLMEAVRIEPPTPELLPHLSNSSDRLRGQTITEEANLFGAGESFENNPIMTDVEENDGQKGAEKASSREISPHGLPKNKEPIPKVNFIQPSLIQAALENDSELSEGEIVSAGNQSFLSDKFGS